MSNIKLFEFTNQVGNRFPFLLNRLEDAPSQALSNVPRRHNFFMAIWITAGQGKQVIDFESYDIEPYSLTILLPSQVQYWDIKEIPHGFYLLFNAEIFQVHGSYHFLQLLPFLSPSAPQPTILFKDPAEGERINQIFDSLAVAYQNEAWGQGIELSSWLQLLLIEAQRALTIDFPSKALSGGEQIVRDFLSLVESHAIEQHNLGFYAAKLGITTGHLTETVKALYGQPAGAVIRKRVILEAKRLLAHSPQSVAEIATNLNYADPSYFGRAFKRETGTTPNRFRTRFRG